jgi:hypothetical protein
MYSCIHLLMDTDVDFITLLSACIILVFFLFFFFCSSEVWTQGIILLVKCFTTWVMPPSLFYILYGSGRVSCFCLGLPQTTILLPMCSWDHRHMPPCWTYWLRWGLSNPLPGLALNMDPPNIHLWSSWYYRHVPPCPASCWLTLVPTIATSMSCHILACFS